MKKKCKALKHTKFFNEAIREEDLIAPTNIPSRDAFFVCKDCYNKLKDHWRTELERILPLQNIPDMQEYLLRILLGRI